MKEYTIVTTAEITIVFDTEMDIGADEWAESFAQAAKEQLEADDVKVKGVKLFPRDIEE